MSLAEYFVFALFIVLGLISLLSALFNFDWYFKTEGARMFVKWWGRTGARLFYFILGFILIGCGILGLCH